MIPSGHRKNFDTLRRAFSAGDVALVECTSKANGDPVFSLCAVQREDNGDFSFVPLARMFDGNPYEELDPPEAA